MQCELEHRHQAPHLAMCLFATDLRHAGHEVACTLVHPSAIPDLADRLSGQADLIVVDSIFPFALVRRLQSGSGLPVVVGGHNALQHALRGPADLAIVGPGRRPVRELVSALGAGEPATSVPGVWARVEGVLRAGPATAPLDLDAELEPFEPDLDWGYAGPPRAPGSNLRVPSVVADAGCIWNRSTLGDGGFYAGVLPRSPDVVMDDEAREQVASWVDREGGCTFCAFRYTAPARGSLRSVVAQARVLVELGARGLSLQTEHPLPLLAALLRELEAAGLASDLDELHTRTIPWLLLRHRADLVAAIGEAERLGIRLVMGQVGFEAFDDLSLAVYHKGLDATENRRAARLLGELSAEHTGFVGTSGHGLIPLHPWTTPESLLETVAACRADAPWLLSSIHPASRVEIYDEFTPLFWKAQDAGLLRPAPDRFGWDWTYSDARTGEAMAAAGSILAAGGGAGEPADVVEEVSRTILSVPDPVARRQHWLSLRDRAQTTILGA